jgi:hypothetical protein
MHTHGIVWAVVAVGTAVSLAVIVRTKWLQSHTLPKCVLLSVVLHAVVAVACSCLGWLSPASWGRSDSGPMTMVVVTAEDPVDGLRPSDGDASPAAEPVADVILEVADDELGHWHKCYHAIMFLQGKWCEFGALANILTRAGRGANSAEVPLSNAAARIARSAPQPEATHSRTARHRLSA